MSKPKILIILETNGISERLGLSNEQIEELATRMLGGRFDVKFLQSIVDFDYDVNAEDLLYRVDTESKNALTDDYDCVVAEGVQAWLWLQSRYNIPVVCINPVLNPRQLIGDMMSCQTIGSFKSINGLRRLRIEDAICVVSADCVLDIDYDEIFGDKNVIYSDFEFDTPEFWDEHQQLVEAIEKIIE